MKVFAEAEAAPAAKRGRATGGKKPELEIPGLYKMDISNKFGAAFFVHEKILKVCSGVMLSSKVEFTFPSNISCIKVSALNEDLLAVGLIGNQTLYIYSII